MTLQTTTFKGARYLVKFHNPIEWADTESYEAIEAVQHNAFTYISKQPVPVGVQIDNTDFWLLWADPNAQMEELRQLVAGYVEDVDALEITVGNLSEDLGAEVTARENADTALQNKIDKLAATMYDDMESVELMVNEYVDYLSSYTVIAKIPLSSFELDGLMDSNNDTVQTFIDYDDCIFGAPAVVSSYVSNGAAGGISTHTTGWGWVAQKQDKSFEWVEDYECALSPSTMLDRNYVNAWISFGALTLNGSIYDVENIPITAPEYDYTLNSYNARSIFGWDNDYLYIGIVDARTPFSKGCTFSELQTFVHSLDIDNCICMDNGGSTQLWFGGIAYNLAHIKDPSASQYSKPGETRKKTLAVIKRKEA